MEPTQTPSPTDQPPAIQEVTPKAPEVTPAAPAVSVPATAEPRNFFAALLLTTIAGFTGLHQLYLGNKTQAWVRFGLLIASIPLSLVFIGGLISLALAIWALVDFFIIYFQRKDADGNSLADSPRDKKAAKIYFISFIVVGVIYIVGILLAIILIAYSGIQQKALEVKNQAESTPSSNYNYRDYNVTE